MYHVDRMEALSHDLWRKRAGSILPILLFWAVLVAITSTSTAPQGLERTWAEGLKRAAISWTLWAALAPVIIAADRLLPVSREALFKRFVFHIPLSFIFTTIRQFLSLTVLPIFLHVDPVRSGGLAEYLRFWFKGLFQSSVLGYWIVVLIYYAISYQRYIKDRELQRLELERQISDSRLEALRTQLRPNFLFNALRSISATLERNPRTARRQLGELGELLREGLAHSEEQEVPLAQEIGFLEQYVEIQQTALKRFGMSLKPAPDVLHALVPTFILQPLVETAILANGPHDSRDRNVEVRAWRTDGQLHLQVEDRGSPMPNGAEQGDTFGNSMSSLRERLKRLYGDVNQSFEIVREPGQGLRMDVSIPFREG